MIYLELKLRLPELLLMRVDKITMATSVEARVPFLDHHLVEYAMGLPRSLKVSGTSGKHILKQALEEVLPRDLFTRSAAWWPLREWFRVVSVWFDSHLLTRLCARATFRYGFVTACLRTSPRQRMGVHLWPCLT